jgi:hypothetical protein
LDRRIGIQLVFSKGDLLILYHLSQLPRPVIGGAQWCQCSLHNMWEKLGRSIVGRQQIPWRPSRYRAAQEVNAESSPFWHVCGNLHTARAQPQLPLGICLPSFRVCWKIEHATNCAHGGSSKTRSQGQETRRAGRHRNVLGSLGMSKFRRPLRVV